MFRVSAALSRRAGLLAKQTAIITGSGQGIGAEAAKLFAFEGAKVVVCDIDPVKSNQVADTINKDFPGQAISVPGDVTNTNYIPEIFESAQKFGQGSIDILVNNAGFTWDGTLHKMSDKQWEVIMAVHSTATFRILREASKYFRIADGKQRSICNVSSTSGTHGNFGQANYAAAKASVIGLTKTIAKEWGPKFNMQANAVAFGRIDTRLTRAKEDGEYVLSPTGDRIPLGIPKANLPSDGQFVDIPLGRAGTAVEAAGTLLAVCSPLFGYVSGQTIEVTGGRNI